MERLRELRKQHGLTTTALANIVGCSNPTITHYEKGDRKPDPEMLKKLADYFGVSVDYLLGRNEKSSPAEQESVKIPDALKPYQFAFFEGMDGLSEESVKDILKYVQFTREKEKQEKEKKK